MQNRSCSAKKLNGYMSGRYKRNSYLHLTPPQSEKEQHSQSKLFWPIHVGEQEFYLKLQEAYLKAALKA